MLRYKDDSRCNNGDFFAQLRAHKILKMKNKQIDISASFIKLS